VLLFEDGVGGGNQLQGLLGLATATAGRNYFETRCRMLLRTTRANLSGDVKVKP
jgi:hypothetical protein